MKTSLARSIPVLALALALAAGSVMAQDLPVIKGKKAVATVQGEPITLTEFTSQVAAMNRERPAGTKADRAAELALLERMVNMVVIVQEARRMEMHKLPEYRQMMDANARVTLRQALVDRVVKDIKPDPKAAEERYRAAVREWQIGVVLFETEVRAKAMEAELKAGKDFGHLAKAYLADGRAKKVEQSGFLKRETIDPHLARVVATLTPGSTSPVITGPSGPMILKLEDVRYPDNPAERAKAEEAVLTGQRMDAVKAFEQTLVKKYVKINRAVLDGVDYEAETPGLEGYLKDKRAVAEIKGEPPLTVAEMTEELKFKFFHGTKLAAERKKLNARKQEVVDSLLHRKVFRKEALRLGLEKTDTYKNMIKEYEYSTLFGAVLNKVLAPDITLTEDEVKAYYAEHKGEYATPEMVRIKALAFSQRKSAESALESLRTGADFQWVADRADAQIAPGTAGLLVFDGRPIITTELPDGVQKAVAAAKAGDARLYVSPENYFYVLAIEGVAPATPQPYEEVREEMARKVLDTKIGKAVEAYAAKLRALSDVKIYLKAS